MKAAQLRLDFAPRRSGALPGARWLAMLGGVLLTCVVLLWANALNQRQAAVAVLTQEHQRRAAATPPPHAAPIEPQQLARERTIRETTRGLFTPWADLLAALEAAPTEAVALLSVEPSAAKRSVRLNAEARDAKAMLVYLAALQRDSRLTQVVLVSHQVQLQTPGTPVRFQIHALWTDAP